MKKSLIALAVIAASGAALAQSNVTLYGRLDASLANTKDKIANTSTTSMESGLLTTSRWGIRGSEDLGAGLKANFNLETGIKNDTGAQGTNNSAFDRQSWVGLSGAFGAVKLGRSDTAFDDIRDLAVVNNLWDSEFTPNKIAYTAGVAEYSSRASNQIRYESPSFAGFTAGVSYGLDEQASPVKKDVQAFNLRYRAGALDAGIGYQEQKDNTAPASNLEYTAISASYDFGSFRVSGGYNLAENGLKQEDDEFSVGVAVPYGNFEFSAGYAYSKSKTAGVTQAKGSAYALGATYALSKRTKVYAAYLDGDVENGAGTKTADKRVYAAGIRHDF
ncbi:porin [Hydrogenophaga sp.]|jgi:predicted porin|uniref:porin n=1 Tax=Hydrogenophaga sp. TaxID=1904254 RepID=UPI00391AD7F5